MAVPPELVAFAPSVEVQQPNEEELIDGIVASMGRVNRQMFDKHRHGIRDAHAKSHGVLKGTLTVYDTLPEPGGGLLPTEWRGIRNQSPITPGSREDAH